MYDVHGTARGALVQLINTSTATGGTSTSTFYDGQGTTVSRGPYTLSPPDANGIVTITGSGRIVSGTGKGRHGQIHRHRDCQHQTTVTNVKVVGTETY